MTQTFKSTIFALILLALTSQSVALGFMDCQSNMSPGNGVLIMSMPLSDTEHLGMESPSHAMDMDAMDMDAMDMDAMDMDAMDMDAMNMDTMQGSDCCDLNCQCLSSGCTSAALVPTQKLYLNPNTDQKVKQAGIHPFKRDLNSIYKPPKTR